MDDIRREDMRLFWREMQQPVRLGAILVSAWFSWFGISSIGTPGLGIVTILALPLVVGVCSISAWNDSKRHRFRSHRIRTHWYACEDRLRRFEVALKKLRKQHVADLHEMPQTIRSVGQALYLALRRADSIAYEVSQTERGLFATPQPSVQPSSDAQSQELYRIADKNIAEYKAHFAGVMSGVERAEAQAAVFITTLDSLRMRMLGYRLVGRSPEVPSQDFLEALTEARSQLHAIDTALEELDLVRYPRTISVLPADEETQARNQPGG